MALQIGSAASDDVVITLYNDQSGVETPLQVSAGLAALCAYADAWARQESRRDTATLTFSSTLAAMVAGTHELCGWLRLHLALRGSKVDSVTKARMFPGLGLPAARLTTTYSFRQALEQALRLAGDRTLDVRHLMAAYPVIKAYHTGDFLRLRIDRRAWCLALADRLQRTEPLEALEWKAYERLAPEVLLPRYRPDLPTGADLLGVGREVEAFSMLIAAPRTAMPLSIGVFGAWGSGKSYFMARMEERVAALAGARGGPYLHRIAQVRFNAWHYSEGDVVASLVDQIFRNLRFGPDESSVVLAKRRADAMAQVTAADAEWHLMQTQADVAEAEEARLRDESRRVSAEQSAEVQRTAEQLTAAQAAVTNAEQGLTDALAAQARAVEAARRTAAARTALQVVTDTILKDPTIARLDADVRRTADEARWIGANRWTIVWGIAVVALTAVGLLIVPVVRDSALVTTLGAVIVAATPFATRAIALLRDLSEKGAAFQRAVLERTEAAVEQAKKETAQQLQEQDAAVASARATVEMLRGKMGDLSVAAQEAKQAVEAGERRRQEAGDRLATAAATAAAARRTLDVLTVGSLLGDTIHEAGDTEVFRKRLGTMSYARSYFQRLSETMRAARKEAADGDGTPPVLERVVLYIDDLDRCPKEKVRAVLQAVHLLLAFDLFACVVAVDPRWILECLEDSPGVTPVNDVRDADLAVLGGLTTPSDYLEKIFQVPLWLRPVPGDRRAALAAALLERDLPPAERRDPAAIGNDHIATGEGLDGRVETGPALLHEVQIDSRESEFLQNRVAPLLDGNSRALKRFINTYHLVKAALPEVEFDNFANQEPYRVCMAQLAALATQRRRARLLAKLVDDSSQSPPKSLSAWLEGLGSANDDIRSIARALASVLLPELKDLPFDRFAFWFERTRRYSFYL